MQAHHFANDLGCSSPPASFASSLPGIEAVLVAWFRERGYEAEASSLLLEKATGWAAARIMRVRW